METPEHLDLDRCPHCGIDQPNLSLVAPFETSDLRYSHRRFWGTFACKRCGGAVLAELSQNGWPMVSYPARETVDDNIPDRAREYLNQAQESLAAPAGAVMLAASSIDAMLKAKGLVDGNLYSRIDKAAKDHLITDAMAKWAHAVRLDANDQRHADNNAPLPTTKEAKRCTDFARALGEFLFVLPARVHRGLKDAEGGKPAKEVEGRDLGVLLVREANAVLRIPPQ